MIESLPNHMLQKEAADDTEGECTALPCNHCNRITTITLTFSVEKHPSTRERISQEPAGSFIKHETLPHTGDGI